MATLDRDVPDANFIGLDISLKHGAVVVLDSAGELRRALAVCKTAKSAKEFHRQDPRCRADRFPAELEKPTDPDRRRILGLAWMETWCREALTACSVGTDRSNFAALENYAVQAGRGDHRLGEIGGAARLVLLDLAIPFRLHDPSSVKKFITGRGNAEKPEVIAAITARCGLDWPSFSGLERPLVEDLADATALAEMARTEWRVRRGLCTLAELDDSRRHIFLRTTKHQPVNLLDREWITW